MMEMEMPRGEAGLGHCMEPAQPVHAAQLHPSHPLQVYSLHRSASQVRRRVVNKDLKRQTKGLLR